MRQDLGARIDHLECRHRTRDGGWRYLTWRAERHEGVWTFVAEDVTHRRELENNVERDPLTGVLNRRACMARLAEALECAERTGQPVAVIFLDLDGFKGVNDSLGHAVGDRVLSQVALRLEGVLRRSDFLARIGGDEFVVLAGSPGSSEDLDQLAERLRTVVGQPIDTGSGRVVLGVSMGAVLARGGQAADLVAEADAALYRAKPPAAVASSGSTISSAPR